jgi:hypothetical protein
MRSPSSFLSSAVADRLLSNFALLVLGLLTLLLGDPMRAHSDALINPAAPFGILSLQFTFSVSRQTRFSDRAQHRPVADLGGAGDRLARRTHPFEQAIQVAPCPRSG